MRIFTVTEDHLKLLRRANVGWEGSEFGAPAIDCKRPYGNSSVYLDIAEILGIKHEGREEFLAADYERMDRLHKETQTALQIVLATGHFRAGRYEADDWKNDWRCVWVDASGCGSDDDPDVHGY